jgi:hypothetical protein
VVVLYARRDSIYKTIPNCDVWDEDRDARNYVGDDPIIAHPPCRSWSRMKAFATNTKPWERDLARSAVALIRKNGGVLEHPAFSDLWKDQNMPRPGSWDEYGGWTLPILQYWWGHPANKATWLYIVGVGQKEIEPIPLVLGDSELVVGTSSKKRWKKEIPKSAREHTPPELAKWLVRMAQNAKSGQKRHEPDEDSQCS